MLHSLGCQREYPLGGFGKSNSIVFPSCSYQKWLVHSLGGKGTCWVFLGGPLFYFLIMKTTARSLYGRGSQSEDPWEGFARSNVIVFPFSWRK